MYTNFIANNQMLLSTVQRQIQPVVLPAVLSPKGARGGPQKAVNSTPLEKHMKTSH